MIQTMTPWPIDYRRAVLEPAMAALRSGESCSLIGISGVGKSNLVQFIQRHDVQAEYWGNDSIWVLVLDTHGLMLGEQPIEYVVAELIIHRLIVEAERRGVAVELINWATDLHSRLVAQPSAHLALRYLERLCTRFCETYQFRLVLMFDQFDELWQTAPIHFFLNLRNLRDQFKYHVMYVVMTRQQLPRLHPNIQAVEAFWELFTSHTYGLGMYTESEAHIALDRLVARVGGGLPTTARKLIVRACGGHPGLLRTMFLTLMQRGTPLVEEDLPLIPAIASECSKIWTDLPDDERDAIRAIAAGETLAPSTLKTLAELRLKGVCAGLPPQLFAPVFSAYVEQNSMLKTQIERPGIVVDMRFRQVYVDGRELHEKLSPLELNLLAYLATHAGVVCPRGDILAALYPDEAINVNDERLDSILRRVREAVGEGGRSPRYLITHRGAGIQLRSGGIQGEI